MPAITARTTTAAALAGLLAWPGGVGAQGHAAQLPDSVVPEPFTVVPGPHYRAGSLDRLFLGAGWRELWVTPVDAPVFDLARFAGGVEWTRRGGGHQSITLHLEEADGWRRYIFRSVDKFPVVQAMPPAIRGTPAGAIIQDQVSTLFPGAPLLVPPLLDAIDVLHVRPELFVMPDDPRLEVYQDTFAGMLGTVELRPDEAPDDEPGFGGSRKTKGTEQFLEDLGDSGEHRLDEREFLAVRLIDFMINDTDRTADNIRWARFGEAGDYRWRPVPRDRDRAFMDARGWLNTLVMRRLYPKLVEFGPGYSLEGLTHTSFVLDRRLLQRLTRGDFEEVALRVQEAIGDDVIEAVIAELPARWREETAAPRRLRTALTARRDGLPDIALAFYRDLATDVDIHGTGEPEHADVLRHRDGRVTVTMTGREDSERVEVVRHDDGRVTLTLAGSADSAAADPGAFYHRTFIPAETDEVRLYLAGGDDVAIVRGRPSSAIVVRIIGGEGDDVLVDSAGGGATYFYDADGDDRFVTAAGTRVSVQDWRAPEPATGLRLGEAWSPDWGGGRGWSLGFAYAEGAGPVLGIGPSVRSYGFRRLPHHWQVETQMLVAPGTGQLGGAVMADYHAENSPLALALTARGTQFDAFRFYGYGNDSPAVDADLSLVRQKRLAVEPALVWQIGWRSREGLSDPLRGQASAVPGLRPLVGRLDAGPVLYWTDAELRPDAPVTTAGVPGGGAFGRVGLHLGLELDRTDDDPVPTRGWTLRTDLASYPAVWSPTQAFGTASAVGSAYLPLARRGPHLALRAGGALASGGFPVQHAPAVGGSTTLRGYRWQRYTGDASTFASTELRIPVGSVPLFLRWDAGIFGLADVARVWFDGRSEGGWHTGVGGGLWLSALGRGFHVAYARGEEHRLYLKSGVSF